MKVASLFFLIVSITGCAGDAAVRIHGIAPKTQYCNVNLVDEDTGKIITSKAVSDEFTTTFVWGVWAHSKNLKIVAECKGEITKSLTDWRMPRNFSEALELGDISP